MKRIGQIGAATIVLAGLLGWSSSGVLSASADDEPGTASCRTVTYTPSTASRAQVGTLCVPRSTDQVSAILLVHGGGGYTGSRADLRAWQSFYAQRGFVTLSIDYALTGARRPTYPLPEQNAKAAVQYLRLQEDELGTERVVLQGHSAGARLGAIVLTTPDDSSFVGPELYRGVSDAVDGFIGFYGYYGGEQFRSARYYGGPPNGDANAVANASRATGPVLLLHGNEDSLVPAGRSRRFARSLARVGVTVQLDEVDGAVHGYDGYGRNRLTTTGNESADVLLRRLSEMDSVSQQVSS